MIGNDLLHCAIGVQSNLSRVYSLKEWQILYNFAQKQSLIGVLLPGIERLSREQMPDIDTLMEWVGQAEYIKRKNEIVNQRSRELYDTFKKGGYRSCVLKGQGNALYYPQPNLRTSGDIDLWVEGERDNIVAFVRSLGINVHDIHIVHATADFFDDVAVEIHFQPSWMYNPFTEKTLESFFYELGQIQFQLFDSNVGFAHPSIYFNLVYNLVHINRHIFDEGIGLRQIIDYYYILKASDASLREKAMIQLRKFKLGMFTAALMYVLKQVLGMEDSFLLCSPNTKVGKHLLQDILDGGNFGQHGRYARTTTNEQRWTRGFSNMKRNWQFLTTYPEEVLWIPFFKLWHYGWRKFHGYL